MTDLLLIEQQTKQGAAGFSLREAVRDGVARLAIHAGSAIRSNNNKAEGSQRSRIRGLISINKAGSSTKSAAKATTIVRPMSTPK